MNDHVTLFDGRGGEWATTISALGKRGASVQLLSFDAVERESPINITLVQALATGDKMDFIVQKAVELGISAIQPIASERATLKLAGDRAQKRVAHWQAIAQAACEQCGRNRVPAVADIMTLDAYLATSTMGARLMLQPSAMASLVASAAIECPIEIMIGPEGGFSDGEIALAATHGVTPVRFGARVLRTETAGLAAIAALNAVHGDLQ